MTHLTIFAVAEKTGIEVSTIHRYEELGLVAPVAGSGDEKALYEEGAVKQVAFIDHWFNLGTDIEQIRPLLTLVSELNEPIGDIKELKRQLAIEMEKQKPSLDALKQELKEMARL